MGRPKMGEEALRARIRSLETMLSRERFRMNKAFEIAEAAIKATEGGNVKEARRIVREGRETVEAEAAGAGSAGAVAGPKKAGDETRAGR